MVSIYLDHKVVDRWEHLISLLTKTKRKQYLQEPQIKDNYLSATGLQDRLIRLEAKMIPLLHIGINKETIGQLCLWIFFHPTKKLSSQCMIFISVYGKAVLKYYIL